MNKLRVCHSSSLLLACPVFYIFRNSSIIDKDARPYLSHHVPRQAPMVSTGDIEPAAIVTKLRQALSATTDLSNERAGLEEALKVEKNRDNILPRIMSSSGNYDGLFREEMRKYDKLKVHGRREIHYIMLYNISGSEQNSLEPLDFLILTL